MAMVTGPPAYAANVGADMNRMYGLQSQATVVTEGDGANPSYSLRGVEHEVNNCGRVSCWSHDCEHQDDGDKFADQPGLDWVQTTSFSVVATGPPCMGPHAIANARRRAVERLTALEWSTVERTVQTGDCGADPSLSGSDPQLPAGTDPVRPVDALALLEWGFRDYGGPGILHAPSYVYPHLKSWIQRDAGRLTTQMGHGWVFGRGYASVPPGGAAPDRDTPPDLSSVWLYGTGAVRVWRSQIQYPAGGSVEYDFRQNRSVALVERSYTVSIQCPTVAVNVDLTT